jgi:hypothetical protein
MPHIHKALTLSEVREGENMQKNLAYHYVNLEYTIRKVQENKDWK